MKLEIVERVEIVASQDLLNSISTLRDELAVNTDATASAVKLINGFSAELQAAIASASDDSAAVAAVKDVVAHFQANDAALAHAVTAATPQSPAGSVPQVTAPGTSTPTG